MAHAELIANADAADALASAAARVALTPATALYLDPPRILRAPGS